MIYLSGCVRPELLALRSDLGVMLTPAMGNDPDLSETAWAADTGCYSAPQNFSLDSYFAFLKRRSNYLSRCLFATAPDVVGHAQATLDKSAPVLPQLRDLGFKAALVAQDGLESIPPPWADFDALFIGGSTKWKISHHAMRLTAEAKRRGKWVHMGRVNSELRLRTAASWGCDSSDGTYLAFGPDINVPKLLGWLDSLNNQPMMRFA